MRCALQFYSFRMLFPWNCVGLLVYWTVRVCLFAFRMSACVCMCVDRTKQRMDRIRKTVLHAFSMSYCRFWLGLEFARSWIIWILCMRATWASYHRQSDVTSIVVLCVHRIHYDLLLYFPKFCCVSLLIVSGLNWQLRFKSVVNMTRV